MLINKYSGRTFNDISQYPILPWIGPCGSDEAFDIISPRKNKSAFQQNYDIELGNSKAIEEFKLDPEEDEGMQAIENIDFMKKSSEIRNLKLHSGRLTEEKDTVIRKSYQEGVNEFERQVYGESPFHLKFGFSNAQCTLSNLIRITPFTEIFIDYNSKLDHPDRMVSSYQDTWNKVVNIPQCNLELIPEWFYCPKMLVNSNMWYFGERWDGQNVSDIALPKWAQEDPYKFMILQRKFIETSRYTQDINAWIDQLFGTDQQSQKYKNIFFEFCSAEYFKTIDKNEVFSRIILKSLAEFFQLPAKLFDKKHSRSNFRKYRKAEEIQNERKLNVSGVIETSNANDNEEILNIIFSNENQWIYVITKIKTPSPRIRISSRSITK